MNIYRLIFKSILALAIIALIILLVAVAANFYGDTKASKVFANARVGQDESLIVGILGRPDQELPCGMFLWWDGDRANPPANNGLCVKWVRYNYFLSAWAFGYSKDGKLVSRYHYVSE